MDLAYLAISIATGVALLIWAKVETDRQIATVERHDREIAERNKLKPAQ
jgi:hypothetical protein